MRVAIIAGNYFHSYTGTGTYTGLSVVVLFSEEKKEILDLKIENFINQNYDKYGGLLLAIDLDTGKEFE